MIRKSCFLLFFLMIVLWGLNSCGTIQIAPKDQPPKEQAQGEKTSPAKIPPKPTPEGESRQGKSFLDKIIEKISPPDTFTRTYPFDFDLFYPKANSALQDYARNRKGNSFQISRIGSDAVVLRGVYMREGLRERYVSTLTIKPAGSRKSQLEIKFDPSGGNSTSSNPEEAAKELFQIIEKAAGTPAQ